VNFWLKKFMYICFCYIIPVVLSLPVKYQISSNSPPMKSKSIIIFYFLTVACALNLKADIALPAIFGDHMILQQKTQAAIWGKATPRSNVEVITSWDNRNYSNQSDAEGNWKLKVNTPAAGGPFEIQVSDGKTVTLSDVYIGEVWIVSGQSNMQMPMKGYFNEPVKGYNEAVATSRNEYIRLFTVSRDKSLNPKDDLSGQWHECNPETVSEFSATAYFFGRMLQQVLGVPVGLINSSWGGTRIEPWISEMGIKEFDWVNLPDKDQTGDFSQQTPTVLFNAMISPLTDFAVRGALWYQGESNRNEPAEYAQLMPGLIKNWRSEWGLDEMPFYYVQIAPFDYGPAGLNSAYLREAQLKASTVLPKTGMASLMDAGEKSCIHPSDKKAAGDRLAYLALADTYGIKGFKSSGPVLKDMVVEGDMVKLTFNFAENGLTTFGKELSNFKIAGANKRFYDANAYITRDGITLFAPQVSNPVAVRYAFDDFVIGELYNTEGVPASSFRTDEWE
jgi:sialate O-acetylesterase